MQNWIGQLIAIVVAGVVLFIIASVNLRVQRGSVATTQYQAAKINQVDLVGLIDRDFRNIGASYPNYTLAPEDAIIAYDSAGGYFSFWAQTEPGMPPDSVRYEWSPSGTVKIDTAYVTAYSLQRKVNGTLTGGSAGAVTRFDLDFLDATGNPTAPINAQQIEVNLSIISSLGSSDFVETNDWQTVIRPTALAR
jgi:hypothetical protein